MYDRLMLAALEAAVEGLELGLDAEELAACQRLLDRLSAKLGAAYAEFDHASLWDLDGATSMTAWLRDRAAMAAGDAARRLGEARKLRDLPVTAAAALDGTLSGGQLRAVLANVADRSEALFADHEAEMVPLLAPCSVAQVAVAMRRWAAMADAVLAEGECPPERESEVSLSRTFDGRWRLDGDLGSVGGELLDCALHLAQAPLVDGERRAPAERRAEALSDVCRFFLERHEHPEGSRHRPHLNVIVDVVDLGGRAPGQTSTGASFPDGVPVDAVSLETLSCDSVLHRVVMAGRSVVLDYGSATRTISANLFAALVVRDRACRFPGCDRPSQWCEAHHVVHVAEDGPTCPSNLVLLCSRHHHRLHQPGWSASLGPDGGLAVTGPDGRSRSRRPPGASPRPPPGLFAA